MKTRNIRNLVVIGLILLTSLGCSKFEDGPKISFRSVDKRIRHAIWEIQSVTKNDIDISSDVFSHFNGLSFTSNSDDYTIMEELRIYDNSSYAGYGFWSYYANNAYSDHYEDGYKVVFDLKSFPDDTSACYPFPRNKAVLFTIQRLTMKELWLQHTDSIGNNYYVKFKES